MFTHLFLPNPSKILPKKANTSKPAGSLVGVAPGSPIVLIFMFRDIHREYRLGRADRSGLHSHVSPGLSWVWCGQTEWELLSFHDLQELN